MPFIKEAKSNSYFSRYQVKYRRRREGKTDFYARKRLVTQAKNKYNAPKYRLVVRFTNKDIICQIVSSKLQGDVVLTHARARELPRYGIKHGLTSWSSAYAVGLLVARRALTKLGLADKYEGDVEATGEYNLTEPLGDDEPRPFKVFLDVGLKRTSTGSRVFGALKGASDGGLYIPHSENRFPGYDIESKELDAEILNKYILGGHIAEYMEALEEEDEERFKAQFSTYLEDGIGSEDIEEIFSGAHEAIRADPTFKPSEAAKGTDWKSESKKHRAVRLTKQQREDAIQQRIKYYQQAGDLDSLVRVDKGEKYKFMASTFPTDPSQPTPAQPAQPAQPLSQVPEESRSTLSNNSERQGGSADGNENGQEEEHLSDAQKQQKRDEENFQREQQQRQQDKVARRNERIRKLKKRRPLWGVGGVFPTDAEAVDSRGPEHSTNTDNKDDRDALMAAADAVFARGRELGYQQAIQGGLTPSTTNDGSTNYSATPSHYSATPSHPTNQSNDYNFPRTSPNVGKTPNWQVGGVIDDNRSNASRPRPQQQASQYSSFSANPHSQPQQPPQPQPLKSRMSTQQRQHSKYKEMADKELGGGNAQGKEEGQVGGIIDGQTDRPAADKDSTLQGPKAEDKAQGGGTGQIGAFDNNYLDMPEVAHSYEDPNEPIYNYWFNIREYMREPLAEMLGTCIFMIIGTGASCQTLVYTKSPTAAYTNLNWGYGVGVMTGVYISGGVSGGHLNPAITLFLAIFRGFPWKLVWKYWIAQILGAFIGSFIVYGMYSQNLQTLDPFKTVSSTGTASLFPTVPSVENTTVGFAVYQEIVSTAVLTAAVLAMGDADNSPPGASLGAFILALVIMAIGTSLGALSGYAMNPARDLGPRIMLSCVGYGKELWTHNKCWWITGPICGSFGGSIIGALAYDICVYSGLGSPVNFTSSQWARLLNPSHRTHNMVKAGLERQQRERLEREMQDEIQMLEQKKGDKAV
ncbi:hypothetical protein E3P99_03038 [Wallemia hederae]|uniref:Large ribosomal subunit protein uL18 C-terminal eukaryotes domain-containing protein n=1 Tax=Wallemia hederae TaxID=1540922 RepID=A0A4T0FHV1_9BASI|nr:hypothetical protein E3P99_03038 [Wallemia hederae]